MSAVDVADLPALHAAAEMGLDVEVRDVGPSTSMEAHEAKLGVTPGSLCKTLVVRRAEDDHVLVVVPGGRRMDWPKVREALGVSRASMARREDVSAVTGYVPGTVTVLGTTARLPVIVDEAALAHPRIAIGSGGPGVSLLVDTAALIEAVGATVADVTAPA